MSLLEHGDHKKAGRALVIVSAMTIALTQCTARFKEISLLGFQTQINFDEMEFIMRGLVWVYGLIFLFRFVQADVIFLFHDINDAVTGRLARAREIFVKPIEMKMSDATQQFKEDARGLGTTKVRPVKADYDEKHAALRDQRGFRLKIVTTIYRLRGWLEFAVLILIEGILPMAFLFAALWFPVGWRVCPSFTQSVAVQSLVP